MKTIDEKMDEINLIVHELKEKSSSKWTIPILVAIIGVVSSVLGIATQYYFTGPASIRKALAEERATLRKDGLDILIKVNVSFEKVCTVNDKDKTQLISSLDEFRGFADKVRAYKITQDMVSAIENYNDYVAEKCHEINSKKLKVEQRKAYYEESKVLYLNAVEAINNIVYV